MWLLIAVITLLLATLFSAFYASCFEKARKRNLPTTKLERFFSFGIVVFIIAGTAMLFIATGWIWGLVGLGISFLLVYCVNLGVTIAYRTHEYGDPLMLVRVKEVNSVEEQHKTELEDFWNSTSPDEYASLAVDFLKELRKHPREYSQLNQEILPGVIWEGYRNSVKRAYIMGYMTGKGWITEKHFVDFTIYLGDDLAQNMRLVFKGAKSNGNAFCDGFIVVGTRGHLKVSKGIW